MISTPIYDVLVAELGEPPTGEPVCICAVSLEDCALHPVIEFRIGENREWLQLVDGHAAELAALPDEGSFDDLAEVGHA